MVGLNGSGKSTLLKLIHGSIKPDSGVIIRDKRLQIAYMAQEVALNPEDTAFEAAYQGASRLLAIKEELTDIEAKFADPYHYQNDKRLSKLIDHQEKVLAAFNELGGPGLDGRIKVYLRDIGFNDHEMCLPVKHLSGGQKKLLGLVRMLINQPDILLLDEPDNHLDLSGKAMLESLIQGFDGSVIIVSHDRYFLDLIVDEILEVEDGRIAQNPGNYSEYMFEKRLRLERQAARYQAQQKEISRLEQAAKRLMMWGNIYDNPKFSNRGKNILNRLDHLEKIEKPNLDHDVITFGLGGWRGSEKVLAINDLAKSFPSHKKPGLTQILKNINLELRYGDRVGMIGPNGVGKSLLVRMILGELDPDFGSIYLGPGIKIGYYAQEFETLNPNLGLLETICKTGNFPINRGVAFLKKFLFSYEQRDIPVSSLSGGERARLQIALMSLSDANFLILDEPTNHLDIPSCEVLEDALLDFDGTILAISHDRYFLDRIVTRIIELQSSAVTNYMGNYSDYENQFRLSAKSPS